MSQFIKILIFLSGIYSIAVQGLEDPVSTLSHIWNPGRQEQMVSGYHLNYFPVPFIREPLHLVSPLDIQVEAAYIHEAFNQQQRVREKLILWQARLWRGLWRGLSPFSEDDSPTVEEDTSPAELESRASRLLREEAVALIINSARRKRTEASLFPQWQEFHRPDELAAQFLQQFTTLGILSSLLFFSEPATETERGNSDPVALLLQSGDSYFWATLSSQGEVSISRRLSEEIVSDQKLLKQLTALKPIIAKRCSEPFKPMKKYAAKEIPAGERTNGTIIWKVDDVARRREDEKYNEIEFLFSPTILMSSGYQACLRLYLNGNGEDKGTHLSLYFVIKKGQHDDDLQWPFRQKVTLCLLNQSNTNPEEDIRKCFLPPEECDSFQKPEEEFNNGYGFSQFIELEAVFDSNKYVVDDVMYFMVDVDGTDLEDLDASTH